MELISELYGETEATLVYDVHTAPAVGITQHTAEHFRLRDGRITSIKLVFDAAPWQAIMSAAGPTHDEPVPRRHDDSPSVPTVDGPDRPATGPRFEPNGPRSARAAGAGRCRMGVRKPVRGGAGACRFR
ncbi:hypothetical protein WDV06_06880 [Streptomyces racemochromogenes]|uniref:SnoaL-like domain-containing protein n=1 Tax=Streptomyces racemochromogenes TaxID=67353 RepID=A0ABW7P9Y0_9ACTN